MFKIDRYSKFLLENTNSGKVKIYYTERLRELFKDIKFREPNNIVTILLDMENKVEYLDKYTLVDISEDKNNYLTFIQFNRILRNDSNIEGYSLPSNIIDAAQNYLPNYRTEIGLGRWVNRVISEIYNKPVIASQISRLVDLYRSVHDEIYNEEALFEVIKGEEIKKWYNSENYDKSIGQLGNSCMKYNFCEDFFDIYIDNPDVCSLLILYNKTKTKIIGRSLLWITTKDILYQDRIYSNYDSDMFKIKNWAVSRGYVTFDKDSIPLMEVSVKEKVYLEYPYMDTFVCYNPNTGILSSDEYRWPNDGFIKLQDTEGGFISDDVVYSDYYGEFINSYDAVYAIGLNGEDYFNSYEVNQIDGKNYHEDLTVRSSYHDKMMLLDNCVFSEILNDYLDPNDDNVIEIIINSQGHTDWSVISKINTWVEEDGEYYDSSIYIYDPYKKIFLFIDSSKVRKELKEKIQKELNVFSIKDIRKLLKKIYEDNNYDKDSLIEQINKNKIYIEKVRGIYWGYTPDKIPTPEDLLYGAFAYVPGVSYIIENIEEIFGKEIYDKYRRYNYRNINLYKYIFDIYSELDYLKISEDMYKIILLNKLL